MGNTPFSLVPAELPHWAWQRFQLEGDRALTLGFASRAGDRAQLQVVPLAKNLRGFVPLQRCAVRYQFEAREPAARAEVAVLLRHAATVLDTRWAAASPGASLAVALGRRAGRGTFGPELLRALLAPELVEGEAAGGWTLRAVHAPWVASRAADDRSDVLLDFEHADGGRMTVRVGRRDTAEPALAHTAHLSVRSQPSTADEQSSLTLATLVGFLLDVRDHAGLELTFPAPPADAGPADPAGDGRLHLSLRSDCGQNCVFCSLRRQSPAVDGGEAALADALASLAEGRRRGLSHVRITGYDPLAFSRVLDVLEAARREGYARAEIDSPGVRLADRAFCEAVLAAAPPATHFNLALHGATAATHDAITGVPGAFERVLRALDHLTALLGGSERIGLSITAVEANLAELADVVRLAQARGIDPTVRLAYADATSDAPFFSVAPRQTAVADALAALAREGRRLPRIAGIAPCVLHRRLRSAGWRSDAGSAVVAAGRGGDLVHGRAQSGSAAPTSPSSAPCPNASACALAGPCGGALERAYVQKFGLDEFAPVSPGDPAPGETPGAPPRGTEALPPSRTGPV